MVQTVIFILLTLITVIAFISVVLLSLRQLISVAVKKANPKRLATLRKATIVFVSAMVLTAGFTAVSQLTASTPAVIDENGHRPVNSVAELTRIERNGRKQWITIRGHDDSKPVLLFLAGGPGGSQLAAVRHELAELEKHFVVVGWDQPGSGKSYNAQAIKSIDTETYISDGYALTKYLTQRFGQEKIYLVGESWGSALGIFLIHRYPELYHGFIGTGQMVAFAETEILDYKKAMELAAGKNDTAILEKLEANGMPPYYGSDVTWKSAVYLNYLSAYMAGNPAIHDPGYNTFRDVFSSEYGVLDKVNYFRGIINTYNHVYQKLYEIDMRTDYTRLDVPVYFFEGRHDVNAPPSLVEEYFEVLECPEKEIVWFEHSGHSPWLNESDKFVEELLLRFKSN